MAGPGGSGANWVGCCGYYTGTFVRPWLDIPPTGHQVAMRFHEFYRMEDGKVVEMQALWDIPEVMLQARAWPMAPALGREWQVPGPATQDGVLCGPRDPARSTASLKLVADMLAGLGKFATGGVEAMRLGDYWHPKCNWYGPSGIGTGRGIAGFRNWHQIPFLNAMPDRVGSTITGKGNLFADGDYVGVTAWPGMHMRSLDFWRCENGLIRENWVLVDLLHVYRQIGVDVLARMREFNKARSPLSLQDWT
jgi:predicted ester cyclase